MDQITAAANMTEEDEKQEEEENELGLPRQTSVQMPRFIRVNSSKSSAAFFKLTAKPYLSSASTAKAAISAKRKRHMVT